MLQKFKIISFIAVLSLFASCTDDVAVEEPVQTTANSVEPPAPEASASFDAAAVYFAFDDYTLTGEAEAALQSLADHLNSNSTAIVQIAGHCDERGSPEYNLALGERRAQSVKNYLVQLGVSDERVSIISYGEEKPVVEGHDESAWGKNRRAEFVLTNT